MSLINAMGPQAAWLASDAGQGWAVTGLVSSCQVLSRDTNGKYKTSSLWDTGEL